MVQVIPEGGGWVVCVFSVLLSLPGSDCRVRFLVLIRKSFPCGWVCGWEKLVVVFWVALVKFAGFGYKDWAVFVCRAVSVGLLSEAVGTLVWGVCLGA